MLPTAVAASTSPSPLNVPPVIETAALERFKSSGSVIVTLGDKVTVLAGPLFNDVTTLASVGGSLTTLMLTVVVWTGVLKLFDVPPSLSTQVTSRVGSEP